jgi:hypothetical protein
MLAKELAQCPEDQDMAIPRLARPRSVGNLLTVEPLSDEVETTAGRFLARPFSPAPSELLINLGAPPFGGSGAPLRDGRRS